MKKAKLTRSLMMAVSVVALSAVMYGCTHSGDSAPAPTPTPPPMDTDGDGVPDDEDAFPNDPDETMDSDGDGVGDNAQEAMALADAKAAAMAAWQAARDALAGIAGKESANPAAYQRAMNALADAKAAYDAAMAATTSAEAMRHQADAEAANMAAMGFVAMVVASYEAPALGAAQMAASSAADAAKAAYDAAMEALANIEAIKSDDMASYDMAMAKVADARAAYMAAKAASDAAAATSVLADAQAHRATAEAELAKANAANTDAMKYAGMVQTAYDGRIAAEEQAEEQRQMDVADARSAAMQSYMDADADATKAEAEADAAEAGDPGSAVAALAREAAEAARAAANAAKAAHDAITDEMTKAQADAKAAEAATEAGTANTQYMRAENLNSGIQAILQANERQRQMDVASARTEAMGSYTDAEADATKAEAAADAAEAGDPGSAGAIAARAAATASRAAATAAKAAHDAITDDMTKVQADAKAAEAAAEADKANSQYMTAKAANDEIQRVITAANDEEQRQMDVASARTAAMGSYTDAEADAMKAEAQADAAEEGAPGSPSAVAARTAATAARAAATAAKAAHDAITDDMTKVQADAKAEEAAEEAGKANSQYMTAKTQNEAIQNIVAAQKEQQRQADITATKAAVTAAETAKNAADQAADDAEDARDDAKDALDRAKAARTGVEEAEKQYEAAKTAAMMAREAANDAETAYEAAKMAAEGIDDATADDAKTARMTAETEQGKAETARGTADTQKTAAETAEMAAMTAANTHTLRLFLDANAVDVTTPADNPATEADELADAKAAEVASIGDAMAAIANASDGAQTGATGTTATAAWPGDTVENPDTETEEFMAGNLMIAVDPNGSGAAIPFELRASRAAVDLNNDGDMTDDGETRIIQTARKIADLGAFQGYDLWEDDGDAATDTDRARAIVFTNKQKGKDSVLEVTAVAARAVTNQAVATDGTELAKVTSSGTTITGVEWTPSGETALTGTLSCPANTACSIMLDASGDGTVDAISGYTFTGSRAGREAVAAAAATDSHEYLIFGLWLDEATDGTDTFGAFADGGVVGGTDYAAGAPTAAFTGTATYRGKAAGAHHKTGEGVNWFDGDARLTANFGAIDTDAERGTDPAADTSPGTISGEISNIRVNGGDPLSDSIELRQTALTVGTATFNGNARMGAGEIQSDDTVEYPLNGTWSGSFYGANPVVADDGNTPDIDETMPEAAPDAVAGTFGVTRTEGTGDDRVVESFVGAFGAHRPE